MPVPCAARSWIRRSTSRTSSSVSNEVDSSSRSTLARRQVARYGPYLAHPRHPERPRGRLVGEQDILRHDLGRDQIDVLMDRHDAAGWGVVGAAQLQRPAVQRDGAGIGRIEPSQHLGQRRLAGAVLADQPVHAAGAHREVRPPQRPDRGEGPLDAATVEQGRGRVGHGRGFRAGDPPTCRSPAGRRRIPPHCPWSACGSGCPSGPSACRPAAW